jgi:hypothetical protein
VKIAQIGAHPRSSKEEPINYFDILLKFGSETWVLLKREEQRLEAAQTEFLKHLLGITKAYKEKNQCIRGKTGAQNIGKEIKQYQEKWLQHVQRMDTNSGYNTYRGWTQIVATTRTEDGHKQGLQHVQRMDRNSGYSTYRGWTQTEYRNKRYNVNLMDEGT